MSALLGHSSAGFTLSVYQHAVNSMLTGAAEAFERLLGAGAFAGRLHDTSRAASDQADAGGNAWSESGPGWDRTTDRRIMSPLLYH